MRLFMKHQYIYISIIFLVSLTMSAPLWADGGKIEGIVKTEEGTILPGVAVWVSNTTTKTLSDENGHFSLPAPKESKVVVMAFLDGFDMGMRPVSVVEGKNAFVEFILKTETLSYEVTVTQDAPKLMTPSANIGVVTVKPEELASLPGIGEQDMFRSMQFMPGISASNESSSGLYVRGGKPDQNLVLYDGFTVYHVDHFFGIFSAFNANAVDDITLHKGGFDAKYGGRLSSVMELTGKSGNQDQFKFGAGVNFLSANAYAEIPFAGKGGLFLSARRSFQSSLYDKILDKYNDSDAPMQPRPGGGPGGDRPGGGGGFAAMFDMEPTSYFYDLNAKALYKPSDKDVLTLSFYNGSDELDNSRDMEIPSFMEERAEEMGHEMDMEGSITDLNKWGNTGSSFNWLRQWSDKFNTSLTGAYSRYFNDKAYDSSMNLVIKDEDGNEIEPDDDRPRNNNSRVSGEYNLLEDITVRLSNSWKISDSNLLEFGGQIVRNKIGYEYSTTSFRRPEEEGEDGDTVEPMSVLDIHDQGTIFSAYLQDKMRLANFLTITPGLRLSYFDRTAETYVEPRVSFVADLTDRIRFKGAWGRYYQFANNLVREDILQGNREFWILSDGETIPVSSAIHYIAGFSYETKNFLFDIEGYYKELSGLAEFAFRFTPQMEGESYLDYFYNGDGIAKGVEVLFQKKYGNFTGWLCYTLGKVEYTFPEYGEDPFPASHDVTHELKLVGTLKRGNWDLAITWIYASGKPYTEPLGATQEYIYDERMDREIVVNRIEYGPKNGSRLPDYHRLDLSATYNFQLWGGDASAGLSLFNVYNRNNIWRKEYSVVEDELLETDVSYMGFTPSLFLKLTF